MIPTNSLVRNLPSGDDPATTAANSEVVDLLESVVNTKVFRPRNEPKLLKISYILAFKKGDS